MNPVFTGLELRRVTRDYVSMFFIAILPAFFYVIFGAVQQYSEQSAGNGNVGLYIMISMAAYGAVTATVGVGGMAAVERMQGWGRQLGLTPMQDSQYVATKALVALVIAAIPIGLIYLLGYLTGAEGTVSAWLLSGLVVLVGAAVFAVYGLCFGLAFRSEAAVGAASGSLVVLAFLGNIFFPLSGLMLTIAKFTPLYGYVALARYPLTEGHLINTTTGVTTQDPLWIPVANVAVWAVIFCVVAVLLVRRSRTRQ
ncbi:ABC transporter permease [Ornithinicoccus hortensis]|uniref:ABC-2 type transport system permease protein n=1 Tax=Ornithinicoccus hortensis TaxID=82346 RepID=A0A542YN31_9MICO|nr:ABC transporter permease [Ornithinicoccus hortensis]TQL49508.1 ABC-2 type transport system permease protein [Ornithinicoccus hortensis]